MEDIDAGRIRPARPWRRRVGSAVVAAALGLGMGACDGRNVGYAGDGGSEDATVQVDGASNLLYMAPEVDAGPMPEYGVPDFDGGVAPAYAEPFIDAGPTEDYAAPFWDGGADLLYAVPMVDSGVAPDPDGGGDLPAYGVPFCTPEPS